MRIREECRTKIDVVRERKEWDRSQPEVEYFAQMMNRYAITHNGYSFRIDLRDRHLSELVDEIEKGFVAGKLETRSSPVWVEKIELASSPW